MGSVLSALCGAAKTLGAVAKLLSDLSAQYQALLVRINAAPGLPHEKPTEPYWLDDPPFPELVDARSEALPGEADVVIIGSGITAAAVARSLFAEDVVFSGSGARKAGDGPRVVVLEARALCAGATGRNGGHVKASPHELFPRLARIFGKEKGAALTRFTLRTAEAVLEVGEGREVAECRRVETVDFFLDEKGFGDAKGEMAELRKWVPEVKMKVFEREEARQEFGVVADHVFGALVYDAGALWPYRLVASVWREVLDAVGDMLSIETHTPVEEVILDGPGSTEARPYVVRTSRGSIRARHVVHATNAHASQFLPGLRGKMAGIKGHMTVQRPDKEFRWQDGSRSWSILYGGGMFDYVTQRPNGDVMLGGGFARSQGQGVDMVGIYDDGTTDGMTVAHVAGVMETLFGDGWKGGVTRVWSGIIGLTGDMAPFVGRVPGAVSGRKRAKKAGWMGRKESAKLKVKTDEDEDAWEGAEAGEWVSAGYCGDGMVWAWLCGTALGVMISEKEEVVLERGAGFPGGKLEEWFPRDLLVTEQRVNMADLSNLVDELL